MPDFVEERAQAAAGVARDAAVRHAEDGRLELREDLNKVRTALGDALSGGRPAKYGVVLLVMGVVFEGAGNLFGTLAQ